MCNMIIRFYFFQLKSIFFYTRLQDYRCWMQKSHSELYYKIIDFKCCRLYRLSFNTFNFVHFKHVTIGYWNKVTDRYERALQPRQQRFHWFPENKDVFVKTGNLMSLHWALMTGICFSNSFPERSCRRNAETTSISSLQPFFFFYIFWENALMCAQ